MKLISALIVAALFLGLSSCSKTVIPNDCEDPGLDVSYSGDIQPFFNDNCLMCHAGSQAPDLSEGWSHDELMNHGNAVLTDDPCSSTLYQYVESGHGPNAPYDATDIANILSWIFDGAPDN